MQTSEPSSPSGFLFSVRRLNLLSPVLDSPRVSTGFAFPTTSWALLRFPPGYQLIQTHPSFSQKFTKISTIGVREMLRGLGTLVLSQRTQCSSSYPHDSSQVRADLTRSSGFCRHQAHMRSFMQARAHMHKRQVLHLRLREHHRKRGGRKSVRARGTRCVLRDSGGLLHFLASAFSGRIPL